MVKKDEHNSHIAAPRSETVCTSTPATYDLTQNLSGVVLRTAEGAIEPNTREFHQKRPEA